jgi:hypothetical protein
MISRFRTRAAFTWRPAGVLPIALLALALSGVVATQPASAKPSASGWLAGAQNSDGGFAATEGQPSSPAMTGWAMLGLEAVGRNPLDVRSGGETPVSYLRSQAGRLRSVGDLERTILALVGAGLDPHRFAGTDLVAELRTRRDGDGSVDGQVNLTAFYAMAIRAAGGDAGSLARSARWLRRAQNSDGGWGIQPRAPSESDSTGAALQGLVAAGGRGRATAQGAGWLGRAQRSGGGWALGITGVLNSQSTAWSVQGLVAAGGGGDAIGRALGYLSRLHAADGHYRYSAASDQTPIWVTAQALLAVNRRPFPVPAVARAQPQPSSNSDGRDSGSGQGEPSPTRSDPTSTSEPAGGGPEPSAGGGGDNGGGTGGQVSDSGRSAGSAPAGESAAGHAPPAEPAGNGEEPTGADPAAVPVSVSYPAGDDDHTTAYLLVGAGVLGLVLIGGYLWYRRLP